MSVYERSLLAARIGDEIDTDLTAVELLDQNEVWIDGARAVHFIAQMEPRYCRNVVGWLERNAERLAWEMARLASSVPMPSTSTVAFDVVDSGFGGFMGELDNPLSWVRDRRWSSRCSRAPTPKTHETEPLSPTAMDPS